MSETRNENNRSTFGRRAGVYAGALAVAFLLGFVPMWLTARGRGAERDRARAELSVSRMQNRLADALVASRRGEYEAARAAASDFFTSLRTDIDAGDRGALGGDRHDTLRPTLAQRDEIITLLARNDPAAGDRLTELYLAYTQATGGGR